MDNFIGEGSMMMKPSDDIEHDKIREQLESDVEAFIKNGGKVRHCVPGESALFEFQSVDQMKLRRFVIDRQRGN